MERWRRILFFAIGVILLIPLGNPNIYCDIFFGGIGIAYILIALFWPKGRPLWSRSKDDGS